MFSPEFEWVRHARILLIDNYFPPFWPTLDEFDAKKIAAVARAYHLNAIRFGTMGKWCVLQQDIMPKDPNLGNRDLLKEIIDAAHPQGLRVIAYIPTLHILPVDNVVQNHPEWAFKQSPKEGDYVYHWHTGSGRFVALCFNTPYREAYIKFFKHVVTNYDVDATYTDSLRPYNWAGMLCYCSYCQKSFKEMFGRPIPYREDWNTHLTAEDIWDISPYSRPYREGWSGLSQQDKEQLTEFARWRGKILYQVVDKLVSFVSEAKGIPMLTHGISFPPKIDRSLALKHVSLLFESGGDIRHRIETVSYCIGMGLSALQYVGNHVGHYGAWSRICLNRKEIARESAITLLAGGSVMVAGGPQFVYPFPEKVNKTLQETFEVFSKHESLFEGLRPVFFAAVPWSPVKRPLILPENFPDPTKGRVPLEKTEETEYNCRRGAFSAFLSMHLPVHMVEDELLKSPERLKGFRLLVLPNVGYLSEEQQDTIRDYVREGGSLLATYTTSLYVTADEKPRGNFGLADVFGVDKRNPSDKEAIDLYYHYRSTGPVETYHRLHSNHDAVTLLKGVDSLLPAGPFIYTMPRQRTKVISNIVYDGGISVVTPGIVLNCFGKGRVAYISDIPEALYFSGPDPVILDLFGGLLSWLVPEGFPVNVSGPASLFVFLSKKQGHLVLGLVNYTGETFDGTGNLALTRIDYIPTIPEIQFRVRLPQGSSSTYVQALVSEQALKIDFQDGYICGIIKNMGMFEVIDIGYKT